MRKWLAFLDLELFLIQTAEVWYLALNPPSFNSIWSTGFSSYLLACCVVAFKFTLQIPAKACNRLSHFLWPTYSQADIVSTAVQAWAQKCWFLWYLKRLAFWMLRFLVFVIQPDDPLAAFFCSVLPCVMLTQLIAEAIACCNHKIVVLKINK